MPPITADSIPSRSRAAARTALLRMSNAGLGLAASIAISRSLHPTGRGVYAIAATVGAIAAILGGAALPRALQSAWGREHQPALLGRAAVLAGLVGGSIAAVAVASLAVTWQALTPHGMAIIWLAVAGVPTLVASTHLTVAYGLHGRPDRAAKAAIVSGGMQSVLLLWGAWAEMLTPTRVIGITTASLVIMLPAHLALRPWARDAGERVATTTAAVAGLLVRQGLRYQQAGIAAHLLLRADLIVLAALGTNAQVGHYSLALAFTEAILILTSSITQAGSGAQVTGAREGESVDAYTARLARTALAVALTVAAAVGATAWLIIPLLFGAAFAPAVAPLLLLLPGVCALAATPPLELAASRHDVPGVSALASTTALVTMLSLDLILIPWQGMRGAAIAASVGYLTQCLIYLRWFLRRSEQPVALFIPRAQDVWVPLKSILPLHPRRS